MLKIPQLTLAKIVGNTYTDIPMHTTNRDIQPHIFRHMHTKIHPHPQTHTQAHPQTLRKMPHTLHTETITHRDTHLHIPTNTNT